MRTQLPLYFGGGESQARLRRRLVLLAAVLGIVLIGIGVAFRGSIQSSVVTDPRVRHFFTAWHSIKKIGNLKNIGSWFGTSDIREIRLAIDATDVEEMIASLPFDPRTGGFDNMTDDRKKYSDAYFYDERDGYISAVETRYRGLVDSNWTHEKKGYRFKFPHDHYYRGMAGYNLFLPEDRQYFVEPLNAMRAADLGLLTPQFEFVKLSVNKRDFGVYLGADVWSPEFLARADRFDSGNILSLRDPSIGETVNGFDPVKGLSEWQSYTAANPIGPFPEMDLLHQLVTRTNDAEFAKLIPGLVDLQKAYRWMLVHALAGSAHAGDAGNTVLFFQVETGKFELLPWDVELFEPPATQADLWNQHNALVKRILRHPAFLEEFKAVVRSYVQDPTRLDADLAEYDAMVKRYREDFYRDQAKIESDAQFDARVARNRELLKRNFETLAATIDGLESSQITAPARLERPIVYPETFKEYASRFATREAFLARYPFFAASGTVGVVLRAGEYRIAQDVIIPQGLRVTIEPGVTLKFAPAISLISYSPVDARGTSASRIRLMGDGSKPGEPWGVFTVIDATEAPSQFAYLEVRGGKNRPWQGMFITSQFDLRGIRSNVEHSLFADAYGDDGMHVAAGTTELAHLQFVNNSSDALDLDYVQDSVLRDSLFVNEKARGSNGDGVDFSGVDGVKVERVRIAHFGDKGMSVGEQSRNIVVEDSEIFGCSKGVEVKDRARIQFKNTRILGNKLGISSYQKKQEFVRGGDFVGEGMTIGANVHASDIRDGGTVTLQNSRAQAGFRGEGVTQDLPAGLELDPSWGDVRKLPPL